MIGFPRSILPLLAMAFLLSAAQWWALREVPYLSDSHAHLATAASFETAADCLRADLVPFRPLQHLFFHYAARSAPDDAGIARLVPYLLHVLNVLLLYGLARLLSGNRVAAGAAALLFSATPASALSVGWEAAIGWPGMLFGTLLALVGVAAAGRGRRIWPGPIVLLGALVACSFHQLGFLVAPCAWLVHQAVLDPARGPVAATRSLLRSPWLVAACAVCVGLVVYLTLLRENRVHGGVSLEAMPASASRALFAVVPDALRELALDGLRGDSGWFALLVGVALALFAIAFVAYVASRGGRGARAALGMSLLHVVVPAVMAGYTQRYAYTAAAFVSMALAFLAVRTPSGRTPSGRMPRPWLVGFAVLFAFQLYDLAAGIREMRRAGGLAGAALDSVVDAVADVDEGEKRQLVLVGAPYRVGFGDGVPVFRYGLQQAVEARGVSLPVRAVRMEDVPFGTSLRKVSEARLAQMSRGSLVLVYDPYAQRYVRE